MTLLDELETDGADPISQRPLGRREKQKAKRLQRIKQAARELFVKKGYDRTTLRAVGARAKVGAGTIFRYFEDKRDLLMLLFNDDHAQITDESLKTLTAELSFLDVSIAGFRPYYRYFATHPEFTRAVLREATFYGMSPTPSVNRRESVDRSLARIKKTISIGRSRREILAGESDDMLALLIFEIYQTEVRRWLMRETLDVEAGLAEMRRALALVLNGLAHAS
jgi:TetR/AcrR family transcriptional regulator, cholesterol catabolism regulator